MYIKCWLLYMSYTPKALTEFAWSREEGQLTAVCMGDIMHRTYICKAKAVRICFMWLQMQDRICIPIYVAKRKETTVS